MNEYFKEEENTDETEIKMMNAIASLSDVLLRKRNEAVEYRAASGIERMWREDDALFDGAEAAGPSNSQGPFSPGGINVLDVVQNGGMAPKSKGPRRSKVIVNIIRGKCETAEGRFSDILLPIDDKNWGYKVTPVPDISKALKDDRQAGKEGRPLMDKEGNPLKISDVARMDLNKIKEKMKGMEAEVDDQLTECKYNAETRKLITAAVRTGTGIMKGPNVVKRTRKAWLPQTQDGKTVHVLEVHEDHRPTSEQVSCWNVYPDPDVGEDIKKAAYIWESDTIKPSELRDLYGIEGYIDSQIEQILIEYPQKTNVGYDAESKKYKFSFKNASRGENYESWTYYGYLGRDELEALGVDLEHDTISQSFSVCAVFVNEKPIKVCLNTLDTGDMPYDFFQWTSVRDSPWGIGLPRMMMWLQRILTAAWRAMMDNAGDSSGANVVIGPGIEPADQIMELTAKKIWQWSGEGDESEFDARKMFAQFQVASNQGDLERIIELVLKFVDLETSIPTIFQGEQMEMPETLGATNIMVDSNNVGLRGRVKRFDDQVTDNHLSRYYHWNMQYNENSDIKGDFSVDPRGTSVLLQKDQQAQTLQQVMNYKADPDINLMVDWEKAIKQLFSALGLDILKSEDDYRKAKELKAKQPQMEDPKIVSAKIKSDTDLKKAQLNQESDINEIQTKGQLTEAELAFKAQEAEKDRQFKLEMLAMERDLKMMEFSQNRNIGLDKIKAMLTDSSMKLKTQIALTNKDGKAPGGIATPVVEPVGRADDGKSYTE